MELLPGLALVLTILPALPFPLQPPVAMDPQTEFPGFSLPPIGLLRGLPRLFPDIPDPVCSSRTFFEAQSVFAPRACIRVCPSA